MLGELLQLTYRGCVVDYRPHHDPLVASCVPNSTRTEARELLLSQLASIWSPGSQHSEQNLEVCQRRRPRGQVRWIALNPEPKSILIRRLLDDARKDNLEIWVLDGGLSQRTVKRLWRSWEPTEARLALVSTDPDRLDGLPPLGSHLSTATYLRLFMPEMLNGRDRAIYLDADTLVLSDLSELWDVGLQHHPIAAVQEAYVPYVSSDNGLMNWRELGFEPDAKYFNAGVMVLDLARWREENLTLKK
jgi:hypothetical protein